MSGQDYSKSPVVCGIRFNCTFTYENDLSRKASKVVYYENFEINLAILYSIFSLFGSGIFVLADI